MGVPYLACGYDLMARMGHDSERAAMIPELAHDRVFVRDASR